MRLNDVSSQVQTPLFLNSSRFNDVKDDIINKVYAEKQT